MFGFELLAEEKIRAAIAAGEFDRVPGRGKPLRFDDPATLRPEDRLAYLVLKNSGFLPEFLRLRKDLESQLQDLERERDQARSRLDSLFQQIRLVTDALASGASSEPSVSTFRQSLALLRLSLYLAFAPQRQRQPRSASASSSSSKTGARLAALRRAYRAERRRGRLRLHELARRAETTAQRLEDALVEKEIRDRKPLIVHLGGPFVSSEEMVAEFDRSFPAAV